MREIKFRGKSKSGYWVTGYLYVSDSKTYIINKGHYTSPVEVFPESVGQFTGLQDLTGKDIYEGDICKYYNDSDKDGIGIIEDDYIKWISGTIAKTNLMTPLYYLKCGSEFEVLGNIYENPELLEQGRVVTQESESMSR